MQCRDCSDTIAPGLTVGKVDVLWSSGDGIWGPAAAPELFCKRCWGLSLAAGYYQTQCLREKARPSWAATAGNMLTNKGALVGTLAVRGPDGRPSGSAVSGPRSVGRIRICVSMA